MPQKREDIKAQNEKNGKVNESKRQNERWSAEANLSLKGKSAGVNKLWCGGATTTRDIILF